MTAGLRKDIRLGDRKIKNLFEQKWKLCTEMQQSLEQKLQKWWQNVILMKNNYYCTKRELEE